MPRNLERITLVKESWPVPAAFDYLPDDPLVPLRAGGMVDWRLG